MGGTVLVTGGSGFVAGWCIVELLRRGYAVRTTVRSVSKESAVRAAIATQMSPTQMSPTQVSQAQLSVVPADLTKDDGWDAAVAGCDYVLHVASPLGWDGSSDSNSLAVAARDGTLRVLRAARQAGVKRVVMTSAAATARPRRELDLVSDETLWADPADPQFDGYRRSKILAERAAWEFMTTNGGAMTLTTVLPSAVFGPVLTRDNLGSVQLIQRLLEGKPPAVPHFGVWVIDVRDLADLHIRAMLAPEAAGERFIGAGEFMWMIDIARTLRAKLGSRAPKVPTRTMPNGVVKFLGLFIPLLRRLVPDLGRRNELTTAKARRVLGFAPRAASTTLVDCAESLLTSASSPE
jgi:dihydroflavonol-4-reductase